MELTDHEILAFKAQLTSPQVPADAAPVATRLVAKVARAISDAEWLVFVRTGTLPVIPSLSPEEVAVLHGT